MRVLVTGAEGFTGVHLCACLERRGSEPVPSTADVLDAPALRDEVASVEPDAIVHLAAKAFVHAQDAASFYDVNLIGTINLLEAAVSAKPGIPVLLASSAQVYGASASGLIDEDAPFAPSNHYAVSKAAMEMTAALYRDRLRLIIVRPFNYTGVGQQDRYLVPKIVAHAARRASCIELGNLDVRRDFGDVRSVVDAYAALLESDAGVYNISSGAVYSVRDILDRLETLTGHTMEVTINPAFVRANDVPTLGGRNDRLRSALPDWSPRSLDDTLAWMLAHAGEPTPTQ